LEKETLAETPALPTVPLLLSAVALSASPVRPMPTASANPLPLRLLPLKLSEPPTLFDVAVAVS
jgi:hypothetical protein